MYTFVFMATTGASQSEADLRSAAQITKRWMPSLGVELEEAYTSLPACNGGWFSLAPARGTGAELISSVTDDGAYAVLAFGEVLSSYRTRTAARHVLNAWRSGGAEQVQQLEGSFSAVVVRKADGAVFLVSDLLGRRALHYYTDGQTLVVSPHEVALVATGYCPPVFDYTSAASIAAVEWSLGRKSLLRRVRICQPTESVRWLHGTVRRTALPPLMMHRIARNDAKALAGQLDEMVDVLRSNTRMFTAGADEVKVTLTAGYDSRVAFSLALAEVDPSRIRSFCHGSAESMDVRVGRRLARMHGVRFTSSEPDPPHPDTFLAHCDLLAFHMNGATCGKRAARELPTFETNPKPLIWGGGGEIYRGARYPGSPYVPRPALTPHDLACILKERTRIEHLPWRSPQLGEAVEHRLAARVEDLGRASPEGYDILDMFYAYERVGIWGAMVPRSTWGDRRWSPFTSTRLLRLGYAMPAPISHYATIHRACLRRLAPKAYWQLVNGKMLPPLDRPGQAARLLRAARRSTARLLQWSRTDNKNPGSRRADCFGGPLASTLREALTDRGSFACELFGRRSTLALLDEHTAQACDHTQTLGFLIILERWRRMVLDVAQEAQAAASPVSRRVAQHAPALHRWPARALPGAVRSKWIGHAVEGAREQQQASQRASDQAMPEINRKILLSDSEWTADGRPQILLSALLPGKMTAVLEIGDNRVAEYKHPENLRSLAALFEQAADEMEHTAPPDAAQPPLGKDGGYGRSPLAPDPLSPLDPGEVVLEDAEDARG